MVSGMRTGYPRGLNKGLGSKFHDGSRLRQEGSRLRQEIPEGGRRAHHPKRCTGNNEDEDKSPNNTNNTNYQASSQENQRNKDTRILVFLVENYTRMNKTKISSA